jgi:membrane protein
MKKLLSFVKQLNEDDIIGVSAQTTFYLMFALFPLLLFVITLLGYLDLSIGKEELTLFLPEAVVALIEQLPEKPSKSILIIPLAAALWSASSAVWALMRGIHKALNGEKLKSSIRARGLAIAFTLGLALAIAVPIAFSILARDAGLRLNLAGRAGAAGMIFLFIVMLYTFTPGCLNKGKHRVAGAGVAALLWLIVNFAFEKFSPVFLKINPLYSGVSAFLSAAIWMYAISFIILLCSHVGRDVHIAPR